MQQSRSSWPHLVLGVLAHQVDVHHDARVAGGQLTRTLALVDALQGCTGPVHAERQLKTATSSKHTHARLVGTAYIGVRRRSILLLNADPDDTTLTLRKGELAGSSSLRRGPSSTVKPFRQNVMVCTARSGAASTGGSSVAGVGSAPSVLSAHS